MDMAGRYFGGAMVGDSVFTAHAVPVFAGTFAGPGGRAAGKAGFPETQTPLGCRRWGGEHFGALRVYSDTAGGVGGEGAVHSESKTPGCAGDCPKGDHSSARLAGRCGAADAGGGSGSAPECGGRSVFQKIHSVRAGGRQDPPKGHGSCAVAAPGGSDFVHRVGIGIHDLCPAAKAAPKAALLAA